MDVQVHNIRMEIISGFTEGGQEIIFRRDRDFDEKFFIIHENSFKLLMRIADWTL